MVDFCKLLCYFPVSSDPVYSLLELVRVTLSRLQPLQLLHQLHVTSHCSAKQAPCLMQLTGTLDTSHCMSLLAMAPQFGLLCLSLSGLADVQSGSVAGVAGKPEWLHFLVPPRDDVALLLPWSTRHASSER